jgi:hypothetical protein
MVDYGRKPKNRHINMADGKTVYRWLKYGGHPYIK